MTLGKACLCDQRRLTAVSRRHILPSVRLCRVSDSRQRGCLTSVWLCRKPDIWHRGALPNAFICECRQRGYFPSVGLCRARHSANRVFVESPIFGPWQSLRHSAMATFPVVNDDEMFGLLCFILMSAEDLKWLRDLFSSSEPYTKIFEVHCPVITIFYLKYPRIFVVLIGFI